MLVINKYGISRNIDEKKLQQYKDKGYTAVEQDTQPDEDKQEKKSVKAGDGNGADGANSKA